MSDEQYKRSVPALTGFSISEISQSSHGPLVLVTLQTGAAPTHDIEIAMDPDKAADLGKRLAELAGRMQSGIH